MRLSPGSAASAAELVPLFRSVLERCLVRPGEVVLLHTDTRANPEYAAAALGAALELGASPYQLTVPTRHPQIEELESVARAWEEADLVLDLVSTGAHLFSPLNTRAVDKGTRVLRIAEPADVLERMTPSDEVRERTRHYADRLSAGHALTVTSPAGTRLEMDIGDRAGGAQYGLADEPSRWDHWPSGLALVAPREGSVRGRLVLDVGDLVFTLGRFVGEPVSCAIDDGRITEICGGVDALLLREWLDAQEGDGSRLIGLVGWGTDHRARWDRVAWHFHEAAGTMDAESFAGGVRIGLGNNASSMLRGENACRSHIDIQLRGCTVTVDREVLVEDGRLIKATSKTSASPTRGER